MRRQTQWARTLPFDKLKGQKVSKVAHLHAALTFALKHAISKISLKKRSKKSCCVIGAAWVSSCEDLIKVEVSTQELVLAILPEQERSVLFISLLHRAFTYAHSQRSTSANNTASEHECRKSACCQKSNHKSECMSVFLCVCVVCAKQELTLKGERDNKEAEEREKAEMDVMLHEKRVQSAIRIQAVWRG